MRQMEFTYTIDDIKISNEIISIKNSLVVFSMFTHLFFVKILFTMITFFVFNSALNEFNLFARNFISYLMAIFTYIFCTVIYSYGTFQHGGGFLTVSQRTINSIDTTITLSDDGFSIKNDKHYLFKNTKNYKWKDLKKTNIYSNCILIQTNDYFIILLPKRLFLNFDDMQSYYNEIKEF